MTRWIISIAAGLVLTATAATAAPQVLGIVASNGPMPMACDDDECSAIVSTFCLQRWRSIPPYGAPYEPSHPERLTMTLIMADGSTRDVPAAPHLRFTGYDRYSAARMSVPRATIDALGAIDVAVTIGTGLSLVPVPQAGDGDPQTDDELRAAIGPLRIAAAKYLDGENVQIDAARMMASLLTTLPSRRTIRDDSSKLWQETFGDEAAAGRDPAAVARGRGAYERCSSSEESLRLCLIHKHRAFLESQNDQFWEETGGY